MEILQATLLYIWNNTLLLSRRIPFLNTPAVHLPQNGTFGKTGRKIKELWKSPWVWGGTSRSWLCPGHLHSAVLIISGGRAAVWLYHAGQPPSLSQRRPGWHRAGPEGFAAALIAAMALRLQLGPRQSCSSPGRPCHHPTPLRCPTPAGCWLPAHPTLRPGPSPPLCWGNTAESKGTKWREGEPGSAGAAEEPVLEEIAENVRGR